MRRKKIFIASPLYLQTVSASSLSSTSLWHKKVSPTIMDRGQYNWGGGLRGRKCKLSLFSGFFSGSINHTVALYSS